MADSPSRKRKAIALQSDPDDPSATAEQEVGEFSILISKFQRVRTKKNVKSRLEPLLAMLPTEYLRFRHFPKRRRLLLDFPSEESAREALPIVQGFDARWVVEVERKRKKRRVAQPNRKKVSQSVTPLAHLPYPQQLQKKLGQVRQRFQRMLRTTNFRALRNASPLPPPPPSSSLSTVVGDTQPYTRTHPLAPAERFVHLGIVPSPVTVGYRNNSEFSIGWINEDAITDDVTEIRVGMLRGAWAEGFRGIASVQDCLHLSSTSKLLSLRMQSVVQGAASLEPPILPYRRADNVGFWRMLKVRETVNGDVLLLIQVKEEIADVRWKSMVVDGLLQRSGTIPGALPQDEENEEESVEDSQQFVIRGIQVQYNANLSNAAPEDSKIETLWGEDSITEELLNLKFNVSAKSFFQVNTKGAEVLFSIVREWLPLRGNTEEEEEEEGEGGSVVPPPPPPPVTGFGGRVLILDVCCGTGTIGQLLSPFADLVIGIDISASSIRDAKANAEMNGIGNVTYVCAPAEKAILSILQEHARQFEHIVAVVDPPRSGLHRTVVKTLRSFAQIKNLLYVSCNVGTMMENVTNLCKKPSNAYPGIPFVPVQAVAVDMFPHCNHLENVMLMKRS